MSVDPNKKLMKKQNEMEEEGSNLSGKDSDSNKETKKEIVTEEATDEDQTMMDEKKPAAIRMGKTDVKEALEDNTAESTKKKAENTKEYDEAATFSGSNNGQESATTIHGTMDDDDEDKMRENERKIAPGGWTRRADGGGADPTRDDAIAKNKEKTSESMGHDPTAGQDTDKIKARSASTDNDNNTAKEGMVPSSFLGRDTADYAGMEHSSVLGDDSSDDAELDDIDDDESEPAIKINDDATRYASRFSSIVSSDGSVVTASTRELATDLHPVATLGVMGNAEADDEGEETTSEEMATGGGRDYSILGDDQFDSQEQQQLPTNTTGLEASSAENDETTSVGHSIGDDARQGKRSMLMAMFHRNMAGTNPPVNRTRMGNAEADSEEEMVSEAITSDGDGDEGDDSLLLDEEVESMADVEQPMITTELGTDDSQCEEAKLDGDSTGDIPRQEGQDALITSFNQDITRDLLPDPDPVAFQMMRSNGEDDNEHVSAATVDGDEEGGSSLLSEGVGTNLGGSGHHGASLVLGDDPFHEQEQQQVTKTTGLEQGEVEETTCEENATIGDVREENRRASMTMPDHSTSESAMRQLAGGPDRPLTGNGREREVISRKGDQVQRDYHHKQEDGEASLPQEDDTNKDRLCHETRTSEPDHFGHGLGLPCSPSANIKMTSRQGDSGPTVSATADGGQAVSAAADLGSSDGGEEASHNAVRQAGRLSIMTRFNRRVALTARRQLTNFGAAIRRLGATDGNYAPQQNNQNNNNNNVQTQPGAVRIGGTNDDDNETAVHSNSQIDNAESGMVARVATVYSAIPVAEPYTREDDGSESKLVKLKMTIETEDVKYDEA